MVTLKQEVYTNNSYVNTYLELFKNIRSSKLYLFHQKNGYFAHLISEALDGLTTIQIKQSILIPLIQKFENLLNELDEIPQNQWELLVEKLEFARTFIKRPVIFNGDIQDGTSLRNIRGTIRSRAKRVGEYIFDSESGEYSIILDEIHLNKCVCMLIEA